ncbi:inverted formin-2-like [Schistocerca americana]|uniref:inverted formin-2-like n=1 Tax=Schistocerca americana TaxID=7009 RepID=UPI001F4FA853|nr:inverted formin-2-like [Schistocerca americana]
MMSVTCDQQHWFRIIVSELRNKENVLLSFINCLTLGCHNVHRRVQIRNEFLGRGLGPILSSLSATDDKELHMQYSAFIDYQHRDEMELESTKQLTHHQLLETIFEKIADSPHAVRFYSMLQNLAQLDPTNQNVTSTVSTQTEVEYTREVKQLCDNEKQHQLSPSEAKLSFPAPPPLPPPPPCLPLPPISVVSSAIPSASGVLSPSSLAGESVWTEMQSEAKSLRVDFKQMEELFRQKTATVKHRKSSPATLPSPITSKTTLLETKRDLAVNIYLKQFKLGGKVVIEVIKNLKGGDIGPEKLKALLPLLPTEKEKEEFPSRISELKEQLKAVADACNMLKANKRLKEFLALVLQLGNYINAGSYAGNAAGFTLSTLPKLLEIKANISRLTFLHYMVDVAEANNKEILQFTEDASNMKEMARISVELLQEEVTKAISDVKHVASQLKNDTSGIMSQFKDFFKAALKCSNELQQAMNKESWKNKVHQWRLEHLDQPVLKKIRFAPLLGQTLDEFIKPPALQNGFRRIGLVPWNPEAVDYSKIPSNTGKQGKRRLRGRLPSVVTSNQWQEYHHKKEQLKLQIERLKAERAEARKLKKEQSEIAKKLKKQTKAENCRKPKVHKKRTISVSSDSEDEEWSESGSSVDDISMLPDSDLQTSDGKEDDNSDQINITEKETANKEENMNKFYKNGEFLLVSFPEKKSYFIYVCIVQCAFEDGEIEVMALKSCNCQKKVFYVDENDVSVISPSQVIDKLPLLLSNITNEYLKYEFQNSIDCDV